MRRRLLAAALALLAACGGGGDPDPVDPRLVAVQGQGATGFAGNFTPSLPVVQVRDAAGQPVAGVAVTFAVSQGGGSLAFPAATSGADGRASPGAWRFGPAGAQAVTATAAGYDPVTLTATATAPAAGAFGIDLRFLDPQPTDAQRAAFTAARDRWAGIVLGDLPDFGGSIPADPCGADFTLPPVATPVDDVVIFAGVQPIDDNGGILAQAGPCVIRSTSRLTIVGIVVFDEADLALLTASASLADVAFHEMGHVLGFGTLWDDFDLLQGAGSADPFFTGAGARQAFAALQDPAAPFVGNAVPVEGTGGAGTRDGHWRESVFDNELLTGFYDGGSSNLLSSMSIASLRDMGYVVNDANADAYVLPDQLGGLLRAGAGEGAPLAEALAPWPIAVVDPSGRPLRTIAPR